MKLRSFSFLILATLSIGVIAGFKAIKNKVKTRFNEEITAVFQEKAKQLEKNLVDKYDICTWDDEDLVDFDDATDDSNTFSYEPLEEEEIKNIDDKDIQQDAYCTANLNSPKNVLVEPEVIIPFKAPNMEIVKYV